MTRRFGIGIAVVLVLGACGSSDGDVIPSTVGATDTPVTTTPTVSVQETSVRLAKASTEAILTSLEP